MIAKMSLKLIAVATAAVLANAAGAVETDLTGQYGVQSSATAVVGHANQYVFDYAVTNIGQGYALTQTGLDGLTIYIPSTATILSVTVPDSYLNTGSGYWSSGASASLDLSLGGPDKSQNMVAPSGYQAFTFWGQYTESVYQQGSTAHFSITLGNVAVGSNEIGISSYYGYSPVPSTQGFVTNQYGNYTTFTTQAVSAVSAVPEAETYAMLLAGLVMLGFTTRRRRRQG
jgi:hypothetical protein